MTEPMTTLEQRLSAALDARAHQVTEADLGPGEVPDPERRGHRPLLILAAAACTTLVIGVPYAVAQIHNAQSPQRPPATAPPTPTPTAPGTGEGADWPIATVGRIDLDGDGTGETMRLRTDPTVSLNPMGYTRARLEVSLPEGTVYTVFGNAPAYHLEDPVDIPGSKGQELLLGVGTSLEVFSLVDGELKQLEAPADPPLMRRTDKEGRSVTWVADQDGLATVRSIAPVPATDGDVAVQRWAWRVSGSTLVAGDSSTGCASVLDFGTVVSCNAVGDQSLSPVDLTSFPMSVDVHTFITVDHQPVTARLIPRAGLAGDFVAAGDVRLEATVGDHTWQVDLPAGGVPRLYDRGVLTTYGYDRGILVGREGIDGETFQVFYFIDGQLVMLDVPHTKPYLATSSGDAGSPLAGMRTWMHGSRLYTAYGEVRNGQNVYMWELDGTALKPTLIGTYCFDQDQVGHPC